MLARLAHVIARHRKAVIGAGSSSPSSARSPPDRSRSAGPSLLDPRLLRLRGQPAHADASGPACGRRTSSCSTRAVMRRRARRSARRWTCGRRRPGRADELVLLDRQPRVRLAGPAHDVHGDLSAGRGDLRDAERRRGDAHGRGGGLPAGSTVQRDRPRSARGGEHDGETAARASSSRSRSAASARS